MQRKILPACLISAMFLLRPAFAATTVALSSATGSPGQQNMPVAVNIQTNAGGIIGVDLSLQYNAAALQVAGVRAGTTTAGWNVAFSSGQAGTLNIALYSTAAVVGTAGSIAVVLFNANTSAVIGSTSPVQLVTAAFNETPATAVQNGTVTVNGNTTVAITAPLPGSALTGIVPVSAIASDVSGIVQVQFSVDGAITAAATKSPFNFTWNTQGVAAGAHALQAWVYNTAGNVVVSAAVPVTILPATSGNAPGTMRIYPNPFYPSRGQSQVTFDTLPAAASIRVYTLEGELVWEGESDGSGTATWNGTNRSGRKAASGLYLIYAEAAGSKSVKKLSIVK